MDTADQRALSSAEESFRAVAILGLGLMGGSLGLALRAQGFRGRLTGFARRAAVREAALRLGAVDAVFADPAEAIREADLVVLCVPVLAIPSLAESCVAALASNAVLTDVGSTKTWVMRATRAALGAAAPRLVGSHPIAGSERQGIEAADAQLYRGALVVLTPAPDNPPAAVFAVERLWRQVGARVVTLSPEEHDRRLARTSHLPHLVASALAATSGRDRVAEYGPFCGNGFRDTTRIAAGAPDLWLDIVQTNRPALLEEMEAFGERWCALTEAVRREDFEAVRRLLEVGREARRSMLGAADRSPPLGDSA